jgi:Uma2 family endonuclease
MTTQMQRMTADELLQLPDDGMLHELVQGELRTMAPPGAEHGKIAGELFGWLWQYVKTHNLGDVYIAETGFRIATNPDTVRAPDVAFVCSERLSAPTPRGYWPFAPDLVAEVISPSDIYLEVEEKVQEWLAAGVRLVLVVNPRQRSVTSYRSRTDVTFLTEDDTLDGGDVVLGWSLPVRELFPVGDTK